MQARDIRELGHETPDAEGAAPKRDSGIRPVAQADRPTMPPPRRRAPPSLDALRRAGPSAFNAASAAVDEVLYRLSVGDGAGAARVGEELHDAVPLLAASRGVPGAMGAPAATELGLSEEYLLTLIDGAQSCRELLARSQLAAEDSLRGLCELVDRGLVILW